MNSHTEKDTANLLLRRILVLAVLFVLAFIPTVVRYMKLQLVDGDLNMQEADKKKSRTIALRGMRGSITDRNGQPLAYDRKSFDVQFYRDPSMRSNKNARKEYTQIIIRTIDIIEKHGGKVVDDFVLVKNPDWSWSLGSIAGGEAMWRANMSISDTEKYPVDSLYEYFMKTFYIPEDMIWSKARKVLAVWQGVQMTSYLVDTPYTIARDVSFEAVAEISALAPELKGMSITESSARVYPRGDLAGKIVGYTYRIFSDQQDDYKSKGYNLDSDRVGQAGIEKTMEDELSGSIGFRQGSREVEFNSLGQVTQELSRTPAKDGNSVMLTIDNDLQRVTELSLEKTIPIIANEQKSKLRNPDTYELKKKYEDWINKKGEIKTATSGAAIVMDVKSGGVLAMADFPSYDPNEFVGGISNARYKELTEDKRAPLFNKCIQSIDTPGSIFKMVTGIAGVEEGVISVHTEISDMGPYKSNFISGTPPKCWTKYPNDHANQNLERALTNSCNYYFYTVSERLSIKRLENWAMKFGLTRKTNIELPLESTSQIGNQLVLYNKDLPLDKQSTMNPRLYANEIERIITNAGLSEGITYTRERMDEMLSLILPWATENESDIMRNVRQILNEKSGMTAGRIQQLALTSQIRQQLRNLSWSPYNTIMTGIGQSITQLTPIAVARYISAVANGGKVYDAQIVDRIIAPDGAVVKEKEPVLSTDLGDLSDVIPSVHAGMRGVVSHEEGGHAGTAAKYFKGWAYTDIVAGKTGTAQRNNIDIENNAWFVGFLPIADPEIAVVVYIPNGYTGGMASLVFKDVVDYWMTTKTEAERAEILQPNQLVP